MPPPCGRGLLRLVKLLEGDGSADILELGLHLLGLNLGRRFLDGARRAVDDLLGLLEAEAGELADDLDDLDLLVADTFENDVEFVLLFSSSLASAAAIPGIATGAATAVTLNFSLNASTNSESSRTVMPPMVSSSSS